VCVGNSHARRSSEALQRAGFTTKEVLFPTWRPTAANIDSMRVKLSEVLAAYPPSTAICVVVQVLDSFLYFSRSEDGCLVPAVKGSDGKFHAIGDSVLADKEQQLRTFKIMLPLLSAAKDHCIVLVSPLPRYLERGCCGDSDHVANNKQPDYKAKLEDQVYACKNNFKDFAFTNGLRNCRVVAAWPAMKKRPDIWRQDPVHPTECAYDDLAKVIVACIPPNNEKRKRHDTWQGEREGGSPSSKRARVETQQQDRPRSSYQHSGNYSMREGRGGQRPPGRGPRGRYWRGGQPARGWF